MINQNPVDNVAELQELVARNRPGDKINVTFIRDGKRKLTKAVLKNVMGDTKVVERRASLSIEGATFEDVTEEIKNQLPI